MAKKLFIGSIDWNATEAEMSEVFSKIGPVEECVIVTDRMTGRSRGFGFVTYTNDADADKAIAELNGQELNGRALVVNEARPPEKRD